MTRHWHLLKTISVTLLCISLQNNLFISSSKAVSQSWRAVAQDWWSNQDPDGKPRGSRDAACLVTPGRDQRLWNNQPLFVWRGDYRVMGIRELGDALLPTKQVATQGRQFPKRLRYDKEPLQAGKTYEWLFFISKNATKPLDVKPITFQIMGEQERAPITADLKALETRLNAQKATSEEIALQRASYFAQRQLWGDVLQEIYSVESPSETLKQEAAQILQKVCSTSAQSATP